MQIEILRAQRKALCKRLRDTQMQTGDPCDGERVMCGTCERTIDAINAAADQAQRSIHAAEDALESERFQRECF